MLASFFESIRYVGHMYPMVILRIYLGVYFCFSFYDKWTTGFVSLPTVADEIIQNLVQSEAPLWYQNIVSSVVIPQWQIWANINMLSELLIGLSFIIGFLVRPMALVGAFFVFNFVVIGGSTNIEFNRLLFILFLTMAWFSAGRCLGMDYHFYKRKRGLWW